MENHELTKLKIEDQKRSHLRSGKKRQRAVIWLGIIAGIVGVVGILAVTGMLAPALEVQSARVSETFAARPLTILNASGYVVAQRKAAVSSKATGRLEKIYVEEGNVVEANQVIAKLENRDLAASVEEAEANLRVAEARRKNAEAELTDATLYVERHQMLKEKGAVSIQTFDIAEARHKKAVAGERSARFEVERAQAAKKVAQVGLEYSFIRAPFDGVILTKNADEGEVVTPLGGAANTKAAVVTMADLNSLKVEVDVSEVGLEKVKVGSASEIRLDAFPKDRFPGTVHMIVPTADRSKATVLTKVRFDQRDERVLPEMSAKVAFLSRPLQDDEKKPFLGMPLAALRSSSPNKHVFVIGGNRVRKVPIKVGRQWGDTVEVLDGVKEGDLVVLKPDPKLHDGSKVKTKE
ncbi:MAG: efflux RND transporter periplasmic adaptor subunit [Thermodesulfobacteriota bacterium]